MDLDAPLSQVSLAIVDIETTGASVDYGDRITELGVLRVRGGEVEATYEQLLFPQRRISGGASAITGITDEMLENQPIFEHVADTLTSVLKDAVIIGHNVAFDLSFINYEFRRAKRDMQAILGDLPVLDTVRIARKRLGRGGNGLQVLSRRLGITPTGAHRAMVDCETTLQVLACLLEPVGGWNISLRDALAQQGATYALSAASKVRSILPPELASALVDRSRICIEYLDTTQQRTRRVVTPTSVRRMNGALTLIAHCHLRDEQRAFKIDRIVQVELVEDGQLFD